MRKLLFISNSTKPTYEQQLSMDKIKLDNVSIPCIEAALSMGFEVFIGINRTYADQLTCDYNVNFYNANIFRSLFDFKNNFKAFRNLTNLLEKEEIDVIHCNTPIGGVLGRLCGRRAKVQKIIYTAHGFHFYKGAPFINTIFKWAEMLMARLTDVIITINQEDYEVAQSFKLRKGGKVYYIPGVGVNTEDYRLTGIDKNTLKSSLGLKEEDIVLIAMGDLVPRKNYAASIKAISKANNCKLKFIICGMGPEKEKLIQLAKELRVEHQIHFLGFRTDIKELLTIADIFLFTSYQEGLPRSTMEAMASGLPCIVSKIRGNVDLITHGIGGYLCNPQDVNGFSEAINRLAGDKPLRRMMGLNNLEVIKKFDIIKVKSSIRDIYVRELKEVIKV